jgi:hypothetical protein
MLRRTVGTSLLLVFVAALAQPVTAQGVVTPGFSDFSLLAGTGGIDDATLAVGAKYSKAMREMGSGVLGFQASVGFHTWQFGNGYEWQKIPLGLNATYHLQSSSKFAPFLGAGLGYEIANCKGSKLIWGDCSTEKSEIFPIGRVGTRYFATERTAIYADAGVGGALVNVGLAFRIR